MCPLGLGFNTCLETLSVEEVLERGANPLGASVTWKDAKRILAVRLDNMGDVVMTGPALTRHQGNLARSSPHPLGEPRRGQGRAAPALGG